MKGLPVRLLSGAIFVAIVVGAIWGGLYTYGALFLLVQSLALVELHALTLKKSTPWSAVLAVASGVVIYAIFFAVSMLKIPLTSIAFIPIVLMLAAVPEIWNRRGNPFRNFAIIVSGLVLICLPLGLMHFMLVTGSHFEKKLLLGILILVWVYDSFAYIVGSTLGRIKLAERISPMKTVEGVIGGALFCLVAAWGVSMWLGIRPLSDWMIFAGCVVIFGTLGDLLESLVKRHAGVKDSGQLMPGHGGVLDRFDNFFFAVPFMSLWVLLG